MFESVSQVLSALALLTPGVLAAGLAMAALCLLGHLPRGLKIVGYGRKAVDLEAFVAKAMSKEVPDRFPNARAMRQALIATVMRAAAEIEAEGPRGKELADSMRRAVSAAYEPGDSAIIHIGKQAIRDAVGREVRAVKDVHRREGDPVHALLGLLARNVHGRPAIPIPHHVLGQVRQALVGDAALDPGAHKHLAMGHRHWRLRVPFCTLRGTSAKISR